MSVPIYGDGKINCADQINNRAYDFSQAISTKLSKKFESNPWKINLGTATTHNFKAEMLQKKIYSEIHVYLTYIFRLKHQIVGQCKIIESTSVHLCAVNISNCIKIE